MTKAKPLALVVTCEHGGNHVPPPYAALFAGADPVLHSHRGWDPGALAVARAIATHTGAPLFASEVTRLLVELNRSPGHRQLFSVYTRGAPELVRAAILRQHYEPFRQQVRDHIAAQIATHHRVVHLSIHSFTPERNGETRNAEVGVLYDPARARERAVASDWIAAMRTVLPAPWRYRRNYPYRGTADGHTTSLRKAFAGEQYAGLELELNQAVVMESGVAESVAASVATMLNLAQQ